MVFKKHRLAFSMKTLLIHALRSEAELLKKYFSNVEIQLPPTEIDLSTLNNEYDILRTGLGLERCDSALQKIVDPGSYSLIIHFGVSGSLTPDLKIRQIIQGCQFIAKAKPTLLPVVPPLVDHQQVSAVSFLTSDQAITSELSRSQAVALGGQAVDMESYAVAAFCQKNNLPLLALRCISDRAGDSTEGDFKQHYIAAATVLQKFLMEHFLNQSKSQ